MTRSVPVALIRRAVSIGLTLIAVGFLVSTVSSNWSSFKDIDLRPTWGSLLALALFIIAVPVSGLLWGAVLTTITGRPVSKRDAIRVHVQSWLLKYVPGQLGSVAAKILWGSNNGFTRSSVAASFAYENIFQMLASIAFSIPAVLMLVPESRDRFAPIISAALVLQLVILAVPMLARGLIARFSSGADALVLSLPTVLRLEIGYLIPRFLNAIGFVLLANLLVPVIGVEDIVILGATYVLAGIIGILAFLVPSGLGVREAVITAILAPRIGEVDALAIAALARVYATIADLVLAGGLLVTIRKTATSAPSPTTPLTEPPSHD